MKVLPLLHIATLIQTSIMATVELMLPFDKYRRALSIPLHDSQRFSVCPLAWLCYVAYTIYGRQGHISISPAGPAIDYHAVDIQPLKYYYVSKGASCLIVLGPTSHLQSRPGFT